MSCEENLLRVPTAAICAIARHGRSDVEVFLPQSGRGPVLYCKAGSGLDAPDVYRMLEHGVSYVYLRAQEYYNYTSALEAELGQVLSDANVEPFERAVIAHTVGTEVAREFLNSPVTGKNLVRTIDLVDHLVENILLDASVAAHLLNMAGYERSTASHMFMVSGLSILLGAEIFGPDHPMLRSLGTAGMLHDLGKRVIPLEILNKEATLTREELALIHQHPIESVRLLGNDPQVDQAARQMILQHHERIDGTGYPLGLAENAIFTGSKVLSIVDSFHALVGRRGYRDYVEPEEVNRILTMQAGRQFDAEFLTAWCALCRRYAEEMLSQPARIFPLLPSDNEEEHSSKHEHKPGYSPTSDIQRRPTRHGCPKSIIAVCTYAGRLPKGTETPDEFSSLVLDVSRRGLCILTAHPTYRGEIIHLRLPIGGRQVRLRAAVAWCKAKDNVYRTGLRFIKKVEEVECEVPLEMEPLLPVSNSDNLRGDLVENEGEDVSVPETETIKPVRERREQALQALAAIESMRRTDRSAQQTAVTLAFSGDPTVRTKAIDVLAQMGTMMSREAIRSLLTDRNAQVQERAIVAAGVLRLREANITLREVMRTAPDQLALTIAGSLGQMGDQYGLNFAVRFLNKDSAIARRAVIAIEQITGHRFGATREGIKAALRYLTAKKMIKA